MHSSVVVTTFCAVTGHFPNNPIYQAPTTDDGSLHDTDIIMSMLDWEEPQPHRQRGRANGSKKRCVRTWRARECCFFVRTRVLFLFVCIAVRAPKTILLHPSRENRHKGPPRRRRRRRREQLCKTTGRRGWVASAAVAYCASFFPPKK